MNYSFFVQRIRVINLLKINFKSEWISSKQETGLKLEVDGGNANLSITDMQILRDLINGNFCIIFKIIMSVAVDMVPFSGISSVQQTLADNFDRGTFTEGPVYCVCSTDPPSIYFLFKNFPVPKRCISLWKNTQNFWINFFFI